MQAAGIVALFVILICFFAYSNSWSNDYDRRRRNRSTTTRTVSRNAPGGRIDNVTTRKDVDVDVREDLVIYPGSYGGCGLCGGKGRYNCNNCSDCGYCVTPDGNGECVPGDENGPYYREDCRYYEHNDNDAVIFANSFNYPVGYNIISTPYYYNNPNFYWYQGRYWRRRGNRDRNWNRGRDWNRDRDRDWSRGRDGNRNWDRNWNRNGRRSLGSTGSNVSVGTRGSSSNGRRNVTRTISRK